MKAEDVKVQLEDLDGKLAQAEALTLGYDGAPGYVTRTTRYICLKLSMLRMTLDNLRAKVPNKFQSERR